MNKFNIKNNRFNKPTNRLKNDIYKNRLLKHTDDIVVKELFEPIKEKELALNSVNANIERIRMMMRSLEEQLIRLDNEKKNITSLKIDDAIKLPKIADIAKNEKDITDEINDLRKSLDFMLKFKVNLENENRYILEKNRIIEFYKYFEAEINEFETSLKEAVKSYDVLVNEIKVLNKEIYETETIDEHKEELKKQLDERVSLLQIKIDEVAKFMNLISDKKAQLDKVNNNKKQLVNALKESKDQVNNYEQIINGLNQIDETDDKLTKAIELTIEQIKQKHDELQKIETIYVVKIPKEAIEKGQIIVENPKDIPQNTTSKADAIANKESIEKIASKQQISENSINFLDEGYKKLAETFNKILKLDYAKNQDEHITELRSVWNSVVKNKFADIIEYLKQNKLVVDDDLYTTIVGTKEEIEKEKIVDNFFKKTLKAQNAPKTSMEVLNVFLDLIYQRVMLKVTTIEEIEKKKALKKPKEEEQQKKGFGRKKIKAKKLTKKDIEQIIKKIKRKKGGDFSIEEGIDRIADIVVHGERQDAPPQVRDFMKRHRNDVIAEVAVYREPVQKSVQVLGNIISLGKLDEAKRTMSYDDIFHVFMVITTNKDEKYLVEKNQVVNMVELSQNEINRLDTIPHKNVEGLSGLPFGYLIENARNVIGDASFWAYDAADNNCQIFLMNLLKHSGALTDEVRNFLYQDAPKILSQMPAISKALINTATHTAALWDIFIHGRGKY